MVEPVPIAYSAAIFFALTLLGLLTLRVMPGVVVRALAFVLLCYVCLRLTFWLGDRWNLEPVGLGGAWVLALVGIVVVESITRARRRSRVVKTL